MEKLIEFEESYNLGVMHRIWQIIQFSSLCYLDLKNFGFFLISSYIFPNALKSNDFEFLSYSKVGRVLPSTYLLNFGDLLTTLEYL